MLSSYRSQNASDLTQLVDVGASAATQTQTELVLIQTDLLKQQQQQPGASTGGV